MNALILLGQAGLAAGIGYWVIVLIVIAGVVAIGMIVARAAGLNVPDWFIQILWVILAVAVGVLAIKLVLSLL